MKTTGYIFTAIVAASLGCGGGQTSDIADSSGADTVTMQDIADVSAADTGIDTRDATGRDTGSDVVATDTAHDDGPADGLAWDTTETGEADVVPDADNDLPDDIPGDPGDDVPGACTTWRLVETPLTGASLFDPAPLNMTRTARFLAGFVLKCNQMRATPVVTVDATERTIVVRPMLWENTALECAGADLLDHRIVDVLPAANGQWSLRDTAGTEKLAFDVEPPPEGICQYDSLSDCEKDCDCADGVCLGGNGLVGPFTMCARPCEYDADCPSAQSCISADDGLDHYCDAMQNCLGSEDCPVGFICESKHCMPGYKLNQSSRHECSCDSECDLPLRCVEPAGIDRIADPVKRCEYPCPSTGGWCPGAHVCGLAKDDLSGLAGTDSVCVWMGE